MTLQEKEEEIKRKFNKLNPVSDKVTLESFRNIGTKTETDESVYVLKFKGVLNEYRSSINYKELDGISLIDATVNEMKSKALSLVNDDEKQQKVKEKKSYLATQAQAIKASVSATEGDKYYEIYEQYNKVINLFNSIDSSHKYVINSIYNQGFKIIIANVIQNIYESNNISEDTLEKIATELKKLWEICKKNNYVVNSDGNANGFPCHVSAYDIEGKSDKKYIEYNKFRSSRLGAEYGTFYYNGEILLNEFNEENEDIKSTKRYFVNLLAPRKGVKPLGDIGFYWLSKDNPDYGTHNDKDVIVDYPERFKTEMGAPFGVEVSIDEYTKALEEIQSLYSFTKIDEKTLFQNISFLIYDDCDFGKNLIDEISNARKTIDEIDNSIASNNEEQKRDFLAEAGMPPTLGDLFKTIMCHLETFTHMVFTCSQTIYNQIKDNERTPDKLHLNLDDTDIINYDIITSNKSVTPVTPFPGIYREQDYSSTNKESLHPLRGQPPDGIKSMSWTGEIDKNLEKKMEETILVESIYNKITSVYESMLESAGEEIPTSYGIMPYPILPTDLNHSLFPAYSIDRIDGLAAYLAFRMSLLHYCKKINSDQYQMGTIGEVDGFNYWETLRSSVGSDSGALNILRNINDKIGGLDKFDETVRQIVTCTSEDDRFKTDGRYIFERYAKTFGIVDTCNDDGTYTEGRELKKSQRILAEGNNRQGISEYQYRYLEDIKDSSLEENNYYHRFKTNKLIPIGMETFDELANIVTPKRNDTGYLTFDIKASNTTPPTQNDVVVCGTPTHNPSDEHIQYEVTNNDMFRVFIDGGDKYGERAIGQIRDSILNTYKDGDVEIGGGNYKQTFNLSNIRKSYFNIDDSDFVKYFGDKKLSLYPNTAIQEEITDVADPNCIYFPTDKSSIRIPNGYIQSTRNNGKAKVDAKILYDENIKVVKSKLYKSDGETLVGNENQLSDEYLKLVGDGTADLKTLKLRDFDIYVSINNAQKELVSLFGSQLYYKLNEGLSENPFACDAAKAFLFLHTLKYDIKSIYKLGYGAVCVDGVDERPMIVPYGCLLLEGALIYRYRYWNKAAKDLLSPIYADEDGDEPSNITADDGCGFLFYEEGALTTPFIFPRIAIQQEKSKHFLYKNLAISQYYDLYTQNELLHKFEDFVKGDWQTIKNALELKRGDGRVLSVEEFNGFAATIKTFVDNNDTSDIWQVLSEHTPFNYTTSADESRECKLSNFVGNYWYIKPTPSGNLQLRVYEGNTLINDLFYAVYLSKILVSSTVGYNTGTVLSIGKNAFNNYLNGFKKTITGIYNANSEAVTEEPQRENTAQLDKNIDLKVTIYMYIKNLWDRWLLHNNNMGDIVKDNPYSVRNYFINFMFCDSFYRNMYNMTVNMEHAANMISNDHVTDAPKSLHSYLGDIACENKCMFLALPDTVDLGNPDTVTAIANMNSMFVPYTWKEKKKIRQENKFIVMHCYTDSGVIGKQQEAAGEGFDLYAFDDGKNVTSVAKGATELFKNLVGEKEDALRKANKNNPDDPFYKLNMQKIRYGYNVPSFGVAFSRQNNSIFKNINVNMDTPMVTEVYSKTYEDIVNKASGNTAHVTFYGQDIYPVFQNYSYQCEVEMMGNAQVTPMMYIQLLNIPLFNGAYMITSVQHDMKPGYMTTKFKAIKMSKRCPRYVDSAYVETDGTYGGVSGGGSAGGGTYIDTSYGITYGCNGFDVQKAKQGGYEYRPNDGKTVREIKEFSHQCVGGVRRMLRGGTGKGLPDTTPNYGWAGYSAYLPFEKLFVNGENQLYKLVAWYLADGNCSPGAPNGKNRVAWNEWFLSTEYSKSDCCVMFMTKGENPPCVGPKWYSDPENKKIADNLYNETNEFKLSYFKDKKRSMGHGVWWDAEAKQWVSDAVQKPPLINIDSEHPDINKQGSPICYSNGTKYWRLYALNQDCVGNGKMEVTSNVDTNKITGITPEMNNNGREIMRILLIDRRDELGLTPAQAAGIAGVLGGESNWIPTSKNDSSSAFGLAQWLKLRTGEDQGGHYAEYLSKRKGNDELKGKTPEQIHQYFMEHCKTIEDQMDFLIWEMQHITMYNRNSGNDCCNVLGDTYNYNMPLTGGGIIYNVGNIKSVESPYDRDHTKRSYIENKNAIDEIVRRFLLGFMNHKIRQSEVRMEDRCGWAEKAFEIAMSVAP